MNGKNYNSRAFWVQLKQSVLSSLCTDSTEFFKRGARYILFFRTILMIALKAHRSIHNWTISCSGSGAPVRSFVYFEFFLRKCSLSVIANYVEKVYPFRAIDATDTQTVIL